MRTSSVAAANRRLPFMSFAPLREEFDSANDSILVFETTVIADAPPPLTRLTSDELLFRDTVREFARREVRPLVREMDEQAHIPRALIDQLFNLGVMAIEIPEAYGGANAGFFQAVLAVEALSEVDPAVGVLVDVHN